MSDLKDIFSKMVDNLNKAATDLTTLQVTTISGDISHHITDSGSLDFTNAIAELKEKNGKTNAQLKIVAATHIDFDHDSFHFVKKNLTKEEKELLENHTRMIAQAQEARATLFSFMQNVLR